MNKNMVVSRCLEDEMKIRKKAERPQAGRIFTDREEPRNSFWKNYDLAKKDMTGDGEVHVLSYYGIGGIGKSSLLRKLKAEMQEKLSDPRVAVFDFAVAQDSRSVLESLRNQLVDNYKFTFPLFDIGLYVYAKKIGEDMEAPQVKTFVERSPSLSCVLEVMGLIPTVSILSQLTKAADLALSSIANRLNDHKIELAQTEYKDPAELYEHLTCLFANDLTDNLKDAKEPLVIMFDTYEKLVNEMSSIGEPLTNDLWIRGAEGLVQNIPNVLWVIAGREKLKWERFDPDWKDAMETHLLGSLGKKDAEEFLKGAGIADQSLVDGLCELTRGTPVYLDLCVDRYLSLIEKGNVPTIEDFGNDEYSLIERFARYMDDNRKDIVYILSCLGMWTDDMMMDIAPKVLPGFSVTTYEKVKDFSFISKSDDDNYTIHQTVAEALRQNCPKVIREQTEAAATVFCNGMLSKTSVFDTAFTYYTSWLMKYALSRFEDNRALAEFYIENIMQALDEISKSGQFTSANMIFYPFLERAEHSGDDYLYAIALDTQSCFLVYAGNYFNAAEISSKAVELMERVGDAEGYDQEYIRLRQTLADCMRQIGMYQEALETDRETYELCLEEFGENKLDTIVAMSNLCNSFALNGLYKEETELAEKALKKCKELLGEDHPNTLDALARFAYALDDEGRYEEALSTMREVLHKEEELLGTNHPDTISTRINLSMILKNMECFEEALKIGREVLEGYKELYGENHPDTVKAKYNVAGILGDLERYEEELVLEEEVLNKYNELLGAEHPETIRAASGLVATLVELDYYESALELQRQVVAAQQELVGEDHPDTIAAMEMLAWILYDMDENEEALVYAQKVYEYYKANAEKDDENFIDAKELLDEIKKEC